MCWAITIGTGKLAGIFLKTSSNAPGPPVDEPIAKIS